MRYIVIILLVILLCGCGGSLEENPKGNSEVSKNTETEKNTESEVSENGTEEDIGTPVIDDGKEPEFIITLPVNAHVGEKVSYEHAWKIDVEGYDPLEYYPNVDNPSSKWVSAGWVQEYGGQYLRNAYGNPYIPWNHSGFENHETIGNEYTYICEFEAENYIKDVGYDVHNGMSYFWCLIFIDSSAPEGTDSDWVFLNKICFTKEDALEIAKTYQPSWK